MMPKVIGNDSLIARVNEVQGCMYRQSNELGRLNKTVRRYKEENAELREIVGELLTCCWDAYDQRWGWDDDWSILEGRARSLEVRCPDNSERLKEARDLEEMRRLKVVTNEAENGALTALAKRMYVQIRETCSACDGPYCDNFDNDNERCMFETLMREVGIEVNDV